MCEEIDDARETARLDIRAYIDLNKVEYSINNKILKKECKAHCQITYAKQQKDRWHFTAGRNSNKSPI
jgi:hypothetical protein